MLRKLTILLLLVFYSLASFGVSLNFFYCCGKLKSVSLTSHIPETKDCPVQKGKNCCENKTVGTSVSTDQKTSGSPVLALTQPGGIFITPPALFGNQPASTVMSVLALPPADPPEQRPRERSILFSVFRI
ncbi:hypothetical protein SAMN04487894_11168 [Niabella drilacis]|uniref:Uncharacterized protein n=1 Tax=Niabella drilacis (strain DSM 25811 / CCM 8410 / CCUG 62505 / LMG 26954 / E90) TaxID=1285928 RepID=A0A1G6WBB2_NIADE|nr:hypothetical protein SAMN04487894_11168 [Niabella drilacis]